MNTTLVVLLVILGLAAVVALVFVLVDRTKRSLAKENKELKEDLSSAIEEKDRLQAALIEIAQGNTAWQTIAFEALHPTKKEINR